MFSVYTGVIIIKDYSTQEPSFPAMTFNWFSAQMQILQIWIILSKTLQFQFLSSYLDILRGQMVFSIKIFVFWSLIGCKMAIFGTIFRLRNWFGNCNAVCHFTTEICMFVPSNLCMRSKKVSYDCFLLFFHEKGWKNWKTFTWYTNLS